MPNLLDIKDRISSIKNTQKITKAMKMVAAAKVKKSQNKVISARPFSKALSEAFVKVLSSVENMGVSALNIERAIDNYPALMQKRDVKTAGILVVTSNKGLAGAYNANVIRYTLKKIQENKEKGVESKIFIVGTKGVASLKRRAEALGFDIVKSYTKISEPNSSNAIVIAEDLAQAYVDEKLRAKVQESAKVDTLMAFEPDADHILQKIVPMVITNIIYQALLEAV